MSPGNDFLQTIVTPYAQALERWSQPGVSPEFVLDLRSTVLDRASARGGRGKCAIEC